MRILWIGWLPRPHRRRPLPAPSEMQGSSSIPLMSRRSVLGPAHNQLHQPSFEWGRVLGLLATPMGPNQKSTSRTKNAWILFPLVLLRPSSKIFRKGLSLSCRPLVFQLGPIGRAYRSGVNLSLRFFPKPPLQATSSDSLSDSG